MAARLYRMTGHLVATIDPDNVSEANEYLQEHDMEQFLDPGSLKDAVESLTWTLEEDGHKYHVDASTRRLLTKAELKELGKYVSGQNSDGLGEGFEQQDFAKIYDDFCECDWAYHECESTMASFDWETNEHKFELVG